MKKLFIIFCILLIPSIAFPASVTVCDSGNGCNYTTIANAISAIQDGVANTITVRSPYTANERVSVNKAGASDANRLVIVADVGYTPVTKGFIVTSNYVTVNGFEMVACGDVICAKTSANYTSFLNNDIHGSNGSDEPYEIGTDDTNNYRTNLVIQGNKIHAGSGRSAYTLVNFRANNSLIDNNEIYSCVDCDAIHFWGHDTTISNNYIHDITYGNGANHSDHFQTFGDGGYIVAYNIIIENNMCISTGDDLQPFNLSNDYEANIRDITFRNNIFLNFGTQGNAGIPNTRFYNNTFVDVGDINGQNINNLYGGGFDDTGLIIKNNIFLSNYTNDDNPFYQDARTIHTNNYVVRHVGGTYYTEAEWEAETGGINGGDPKFVSWNGSTVTCGTFNWATHKCSNFDFSIQSSSPAKDAGADLSAAWADATDRIGTSRPQNSVWDIGAYEYGATGDVTAPTLSSATISGNGTSLYLVFSENVTVTTNTGFVLTATGSPSLTYVSGSGTNTLLYTIGATVLQDETGITLAYTTGADYIEDAAGNDLDSFTGTAVTNNSTQIDPPAASITVTKTGAGCTVVSSHGGVSCGANCSGEVDAGTVVTLSGWSENGWNPIVYGGDCAANGTVTVTGEKTCTATCTQVYLFP